MGCVGARNRFSDEEETLAVEQAALGFSNHMITEVDCIIRKYSSGDVINANQLKAIQQHLELHLTNYETHKSIDAFMARLKRSGTETYFAQKLLVTGILLSEAEDSQRAKALYEVVDNEETGSIDMAKLSSLLTLWGETACDLGTLADGTPIDLRSKDYIGKCRQVLPRWIELLKKQLGTTTVTKDKFLETLLTIQNVIFLRVREFRYYLAEDAVKNPVNITKQARSGAFASLRSGMKPAQPVVQAAPSGDSAVRSQAVPKQEEVKAP